MQLRSGSGAFPLLVIVLHPDPPCLGSRPPQTAPWVTAMTSMTEGAGTSSEESAATMTVPGKEMKDVEGTIGMTGKTSFPQFCPPASFCGPPPSLPCLYYCFIGRTP